MFIIQDDDASATMAADTRHLARVESGHYRRELRTGDMFVRLEFAEESRLTQFMTIRTTEDAVQVGRVLMDLDRARGQYTCISSGLRHAKKLVLEQGRNRSVVVLLTTDGLTDPPPGITLAVEERRLEAICHWWRNRPDTQIILVGVSRGSRSERSLRRLAELLGARRVSVDALEEGTPIRRAFQIGRTVPPAHPVQSPAPPRHRGAWPPWILPTATGLLGLVMAFRALRRHRSPSGDRNDEDGLDLALPEVELASDQPSDRGWRGKAIVSVTSYGETIPFTVRVPEDAPEGRIILGEAGQVVLPELPGAPLTLIADTGGFQLEAKPGLQNVELNGVTVPIEGGILAIASGARLAWGSHIASIRYTPATPSSRRAVKETSR